MSVCEDVRHRILADGTSSTVPGVAEPRVSAPSRLRHRCGADLWLRSAALNRAGIEVREVARRALPRPRPRTGGKGKVPTGRAVVLALPGRQETTPAMVAAEKGQGRLVHAVDVKVAGGSGLPRAVSEDQLDVERTGSERVFQRINRYQANIRNVDVANSSDASHFLFWKQQKWLARTPRRESSEQYRDPMAYHVWRAAGVMATTPTCEGGTRPRATRTSSTRSGRPSSPRRIRATAARRSPAPMPW
jgi:hypothetical protein